MVKQYLYICSRASGCAAFNCIHHSPHEASLENAKTSPCVQSIVCLFGGYPWDNNVECYSYKSAVDEADEVLNKEA